MSSRVLSKPGPSQGCGQALSFLTSRFAVIPLMPKKKNPKKQMRNIFEKIVD